MRVSLEALSTDRLGQEMAEHPEVLVDRALLLFAILALKERLAEQ